MRLNACAVFGLVALLPLVLLLATTAHGGPGKDPVVAEGERLVHALDCNICHTPKTFTAEGPRLDMSRLLSGHRSDDKIPEIPAASLGPAGWGGLFNNNMTAWAGPWGVSFAMNLTPDDETGIGVWTEDLFVNAIRKGKHMGAGRAILPPMPWEAYSSLTDEELHAIFVYLKSVPPVKNAVPAPLPPAPAGK